MLGSEQTESIIVIAKTAEQVHKHIRHDRNKQRES